LAMFSSWKSQKFNEFNDADSFHSDRSRLFPFSACRRNAKTAG